MTRRRWVGAGVVAAVVVLAGVAAYALRQDEGSSAVRVALVGRDKVVTSDGETLLTAGTGQSIDGFVALRDGWAASLGGQGGSAGALVIRHGEKEERRPFTGRLVPGDGDTEFWVQEQDRLLRLDERGEEIAAAPLDGEAFFVMRGLVDGKVLLGEDKNFWLGVWDPESGTKPVMKDTERGRLLAVSAGHVAYGGDSDRRSPFDVDDVRTEDYDPVTWPQPEGGGSAIRGALSPDGKSLAVLWEHGGSTADLYVARRGETALRRVLADVERTLELAWADDDRVVLVRDADDRASLRVVDARDGDVSETAPVTMTGGVRVVVALQP